MPSEHGVRYRVRVALAREPTVSCSAARAMAWAASITTRQWISTNHGFWLLVDRDRAIREGPARNAWERLVGFLGRVLG